MLIDKNSLGQPSQTTKSVLVGVLAGSLIVLITQIVTKCLP